MKREQTGCVYKMNGAWWGGWYEDVAQADGSKPKRKLVRKRLVEICDRYRSEGDVRPLLKPIIDSLNKVDGASNLSNPLMTPAQFEQQYFKRYEKCMTRTQFVERYYRPYVEGRIDLRSMVTLTEFVENEYLPCVKRIKKPSTHNGYNKLWRTHLKPRLGNVVLRDFQTADATKFLGELAKNKADGGAALGKYSLSHVKWLLVAIFKHAIANSILPGDVETGAGNPARNAQIMEQVTPSEETEASTSEEVLKMLEVLNGKERAAVAFLFFTALRPGEARGARWEDLTETNGKIVRLSVRRSVWKKYITLPKTERSKSPVLIIEPLRSILTELRVANGNPISGPILRGERTNTFIDMTGPTPVEVTERYQNLDELGRDVGEKLGKAGIPWHGWYGLRRGIATLLASVTDGNAYAASGQLRNNVATAERNYIKTKTVPKVTEHGMGLVEAMFSNNSAVQPN